MCIRDSCYLSLARLHGRLWHTRQRLQPTPSGRHPNTDSYTDDRRRTADSNAHIYRDTNSNAHTHQHGNCYPNTDRNVNGDSYAHAHQ